MIQNFEFTYALAVKMIERRLAADAPEPGTIEGMAFPDQIRTAGEAGLVKGDWTEWSSYRKARGTTSHAYDEEKAAEVLAIVPAFLGEAQYLLTRPVAAQPVSGAPPVLVITPDELAIVQEILARHLPGREVRAFGSRVRGKARKYSDLDLVVMGDSRLTLGQLALLEDDFSESLLPYKVDVVDWASTRPEFRAIIEKAWVLVQEAEGKEQRV